VGFTAKGIVELIIKSFVNYLALFTEKVTILPPLAHINTCHINIWIFDLDHTLYPYEAQVMHRVSERMTDYVGRLLSLGYDDARTLQKQYLAEHGTTLAGLMAHHGIDPYHFMDEVHDVSLDGLEADHELNHMIAALTGRKIVFTNADEKHALRMLNHLEMTPLFDGVFHLEHADMVPKPHPDTFAKMMAAHDVSPACAIFFEDSPRNLKPAKDLGMVTVLIGPHAAENDDDFIDIRSASLKACLQSFLA
jgi:putative hydrolase of the HAD superfamily